MDLHSLELIAPCTYKLARARGMRVPGLIIATETLLNAVDIERPLEQVRNVAHLPGIVGYSVAMPDIHWGYGFPIGGVAAMDVEEGVISPGGVGYDINCGVRVALTPVKYHDLNTKQQERLLKEVFQLVPSGVGHGHKKNGLSDRDYQTLLSEGVRWSISQGYGVLRDLEHCESHGCIEGANPDLVSSSAKERGRNQLGSIGSGNHFVEIGQVQHIHLQNIAKDWGLFEGQLYILIHSGSRGLGHQVCQDTLNAFIKQGFAKNYPDPQLVAAPIKSPEGERYCASMAAAANFAFNNRQQILHEVRRAFKNVLGIDPSEIQLLYDVCHNIVKFETHDVEGKKRHLCVHRKGATRAFGPHAAELIPLFQKTGQPVMVPGDMGRASYIMAGLGNPLTFCSSCHGAGRAQSRIQSKKNWKNRDPIESMKQRGIEVKAHSLETIVEEMPEAYKNVDDVVEAVEGAQLANRVARLQPRLVVKG